MSLNNGICIKEGIESTEERRLADVGICGPHH